MKKVVSPRAQCTMYYLLHTTVWLSACPLDCMSCKCLVISRLLPHLPPLSLNTTLYLCASERLLLLSFSCHRLSIILDVRRYFHQRKKSSITHITHNVTHLSSNFLFINAPWVCAIKTGDPRLDFVDISKGRVSRPLSVIENCLCDCSNTIRNLKKWRWRIF